MDEELRRAVTARAHALWRAAGQPEGRELEFWLQAEQELTPLSVAGEEDPYVALDQLGPGALDFIETGVNQQPIPPAPAHGPTARPRCRTNRIRTAACANRAKPWALGRIR